MRHPGLLDSVLPEYDMNVAAESRCGRLKYMVLQ